MTLWEPRHERHRQLLEKYLFTCQCPRCHQPSDVMRTVDWLAEGVVCPSEACGALMELDVSAGLYRCSVG